MRHGKIPLRTQYIILSIEELYREHLYPTIVDIIAEFADTLNEHTANQIYQELVRQAVDTYDCNIQHYEPQVRVPNVHLLLGGDMIRQNTALYTQLCNAYHQFALGLFLHFHTNRLVADWIDLIFHHLDNGNLVLRMVEYPQLDYVNEL